MSTKEIKNINEYFTVEEESDVTPKEKWDNIFSDWMNRIEEKKLTLTLFELRLWLDSLEEFFKSDYLEQMTAKFEGQNAKNYRFQLFILSQICTKIINHLKLLDFKKDPFLVNFEEFIVGKILENISSRHLAYLKEHSSPESWFHSTRIFLQNFKVLLVEILKSDVITAKTYSSIIKLYHREMAGNPIIVSLLEKKFIPKIDKTYQKDISNIISSIDDKGLKKELGIFFILAFRIVKINNFIETNLNKTRNKSIIIPLIIFLKINMENIIYFYENRLKQFLLDYTGDSKTKKKINYAIKDMELEFKKIFEGEFPYYFSSDNEKLNKRKLLKNVIIISDIAIQEFVENIAQIFLPDISGINIFNNYTSRKQKSIELKNKLTKLHSKINDYFSNKGNVTPSDIFFDINLFIETDLNFLLYKDWNEFLKYYNNLVKANFSAEFEINLRSFHSFITNVLKEIIEKKA